MKTSGGPTLQGEEMRVPEHLSQSILKAIGGALREEKEPRLRRMIKVIVSTLICAAILGIPFSFGFKDQLTRVWGVALIVWTLCLGVGFGLYFHPQPRLMVPGFWSPLVFSRLLIFSTLGTIAQILICPSLVFLESPLGWNPLASVSEKLMELGGMNLCMIFCGFVFSALSGLLGLGSIARVISGASLRKLPIILGILFVSQAPLIVVQFASEDLRPFVPSWMAGLLLGWGLATWMSYTLQQHRRRRSSS